MAVHSIFEFRDSNYVSIEGNVRQPGNIPWRENLSLKDVLLATGGISELGDSSTIEISSRIKNANVDKANHREARIFTINLNSENHNGQDVILKPYDLIIVKTLPGYGKQRTVLVLGEVKSPGRTALEKSGDKISDVLKRVGGFKASADSSSITIRRSIKSSLTIAETDRLMRVISGLIPLREAAE